jgi:hypothetical protein
MLAKKAVNPQCYLSLDKDNYDPAMFDMLSDGIKEIIKKSAEYQLVSGNEAVAVDESDPW